MKKLILFLSITLISINVFSQWSHVGTSSSINSLKGYKQIDYSDDQTIAAIIYREDIDESWNDFFAISTNFGTTWTYKQIFDEIKLISLSTIKNTDIIYLSSSKKLYKSINNGTIWDSIQFNVIGLTIRPELTWIKFRTENEGYAFVENNKTIYQTLDGGVTWNSLLICENDYSTFVNFIDSIMIINSGEKIYFYNLTTNDIRTETLDIYVSDIDFVSESHGFIVGYNSGEYETKDGGVTWNQINYPDTFTFWEISNISFYNENIGIMVMDNANYFMTNNGGETWIYIQKEVGLFGEQKPFSTLEMINSTTAIGINGWETGVWVTKTLDISAGNTTEIDVTSCEKPFISVKIQDEKIYFTSSLNMEDVMFKIYSINGNLMYESTETNYQANNKLIKEIKNISNGIFLLHIHSKNITRTYKFKN